jgi:hypothetical protein
LYIMQKAYLIWIVFKGKEQALLIRLLFAV